MVFYLHKGTQSCVCPSREHVFQDVMFYLHIGTQMGRHRLLFTCHLCCTNFCRYLESLSLKWADFAKSVLSSWLAALNVCARVLSSSRTISCTSFLRLSSIVLSLSLSPSSVFTSQLAGLLLFSAFISSFSGRGRSRLRGKSTASSCSTPLLRQLRTLREDLHLEAASPAPANAKADVVEASPDSRLMSRRLRIVGPCFGMLTRVALIVCQ